MHRVVKYSLTLLAGIFLVITLTYAWDAVWNGTNWIQPGQVITSRYLGENFEFLYQHSVPDGFPVCMGSDKALQWDGTKIICGTVSSSGATSYGACGNSNSNLIQGSTFTISDCITAGGNVYDTTGSGDCICKFTSNACPSGWTQYNFWTETRKNTCSGGDAQCGGSCTTGEHLFADQNVESCSYRSGYYTGEPWPNNCSGGYATCYAIVDSIGCF